MKTLVTGGAGFIGSHVVDSLLNEGHEVIVIDDLSLGKEDNIKHNLNNPNFRFIKKSICDNIKEDIKDVQLVFHIAALPRVQFSIENPVKTHEANVNGTLNLLNTCKELGIKRFVFSSTSSVYGDQDILPTKEDLGLNPMSPYALHKAVGEFYCKLFNLLYGMECISLRYFNVYGPRQDASGGYACLIPKFIQKMANQEIPVIFGDGEQTRDFNYVSDVVEANMKAAFTNNKEVFGQSFNVGSGKNFSVNYVSGLITKNTGIEAEHGPSVIEPKNTLADISKIKRYLGWEPKVSFEEGLEKTKEFFTK